MRWARLPHAEVRGKSGRREHSSFIKVTCPLFLEETIEESLDPPNSMVTFVADTPEWKSKGAPSLIHR